VHFFSKDLQRWPEKKNFSLFPASQNDSGEVKTEEKK
jgi:hypothetical protein